MKNPDYFHIGNRLPGIKKLLLIMKLMLILSFAGIIQVSASVYSQQTRMTFSMKDKTLKEVLDQIESNTKFRFFYNENFTDLNRKVNIEARDNRVEEILEELLASSEVTYKVLDNNLIVITPKSMLQQLRITGKVTDAATGEPLPGVYVRIEDTNTGSITDAEGNYTIDVPKDVANLQFSFVGYNTETVPIVGRSQINMSLIAVLTKLDEVIVVGYGTQSKRNVTGSIQSVNSDELADMPVTTTAQKLQGKLSGVQINQTTGRPGEGMKIRIRGQASLTAGSDPLYVVDGFPITGDISFLNPNEIESISILKDASSAALYGSRAANGVVLVTTKHGKTGKTSISFSGNYGWQKVPQKGRPEMMNATEYAQFKKESLEDLGLPVPDVWANPEEYGEGTDFYDKILRVAPMQDYSFNFSSSSDHASTTAVLGYLNQDGVVLNSNYERYSLRINSDFKVLDKVKTGFSLAPTYSIDNSPNTDGINWGGGLIAGALCTWPIFDPEDADGKLVQNFYEPTTGTRQVNPLWSAEAVTRETKNVRLLSNAFAQYEPIKGLVIKSSINFELSDIKFKNISPSTVGAITPTIPSANIRNTGYYSWLNENTVTYSKSIGGHNFDLLGGMTIQKYRFEQFQVSYRGFSDDRVPTIPAASDIIRTPGFAGTGTDNDIQEWSMMSYLARLNYNYKNKYLFSASLRADGSSRFGKDNRWGKFPSVSAGWIVSDEDFMKGFSQLSLLKLRASYGVIGNNNIGNYTQYASVSSGATASNAIFGSTPTVFSGAAQTSLPNTGLTWEKTREYDFGFDVGFFNHRINLSYDYYDRKTTSLLYSVTVAQESGYSSFMSNIGELKFWGHEIMLNTENFAGDFKWETSFNIAFSDNKVLSLAGDIDRIYSGLFQSNITKVGDRIGLLYGMVWDGVYDNTEEFNSSPKAVASQIGTIKFKDVNGDGVITHGGDNDDRAIIGDPTPKFTYGITNNFAYKNFDLSIVMSGSYGNDLIVWADQSLANLDGNFNVYKDVKYRWRSEANPGAGRYGKTTSATANERDWPSSRFVEDASFLTIKNLTLGYSVSTKRVNTLRIFMSIQQLYTFTKYRGANPEASNSFFSTMTTNSLTLGSDFASFPIPRTISFGINIGL
jgi:TonB-linked SusC/RagA family outer membrane protein